MATDDKFYTESDSHVPNPTDVYGTVDTSGTAGAAHGRIEAVTPLFSKAAEDARVFAKKAVDPEDETPDELVILPENQRTRDDALKIINRDAAEMRNPRVNEFQAAAAEEVDVDDADKLHDSQVGTYTG